MATKRESNDNNNETGRKDPRTPEGSPLMLCAEVRGLMGISDYTFREMCGRGELPARKVGGRWYVNRAKLYEQLGL